MSNGNHPTAGLPGDAPSTMLLVLHKLEDMGRRLEKMEEALDRKYAPREAYDSRLIQIEKEIEGIHSDQQWVIRGVLTAAGGLIVSLIYAVLKSGIFK